MSSFSNGQSDHAQLNVGGRIFSCSKVTLTSFSGYFASMFSKGWQEGTDNESKVYFIDQDPDAFQILLSYMRNGFILATSITETVLVQAEFLGIDSLVQAVKCSVYRYLHNHHSQHLHEEECCHFFDEKYGGILSAIHQGVLPQSIRPSMRGYKEFAHLGISNDAVVIPASAPGSSDKTFLPCLMTKLILPEAILYAGSDETSEESISSTSEAQYCYPTLIESLNWLHRNGFREEEKQNALLHCVSDIYNQQPVDPRMIQLHGHTWFSRRVAGKATKGNKGGALYWESPILYHQNASYLDRREFAALVSLYPAYQGDVLEREFAVASSPDGVMSSLKVIDDAADVGFASTRTIYISANPVQWLATHGYTRVENEYSKLLQQLYREGSSKAYLWDNETISRIHVRVFSRDLIE